MERNFAKLPLTRKEVEQIVRAAPSIEAVMNTRHKLVKANGWKDRSPTEKAFVAAAVEENKLLRRPILVSGGEVVVGRDLDGIRALLGG